MVGGLVSVIVPTYNRGGVLPLAVASALAQTHPSLEVIIVDDGSTDGTADLVSRLWGAEPRVRFFRQANRGVAAARNRGIREARGDWFAFLDSDDTWLPWKTKLQIACLTALPEAGMVWTDMEAVGPDGSSLHSRYLRKMYSAWGTRRCESLFDTSLPLSGLGEEISSTVGPDDRLWAGDVYTPMIRGSLVHTSTVMLRRARLLKVGPFDESLRVAGEDYDFHLRTCREGPVAFADVVSIRYRLGMADRITRPENDIHFAQTFLATISRAMARDSGRIHLSPAEVRKVFAEAHWWVASAALERNDPATARGHLMLSLRQRPMQPWLLAPLVKACLPPSSLATLRRWRHRTDARSKHGSSI